MSKVTFTTFTQVLPQQRLEVLDAEMIQPGSPVITTDGKEFRIVKAGAVAIAKGTVTQSPAVVADFVGLAVSGDTAVGAKSISVTLGSTGVDANDLQGGTVYVTNEAGEGVYYTVENHAAAAAAGVLTLNIKEEVVSALVDATSIVAIYANPYVEVIKAPATLTGKVVGVAMNDIPAGEYGFVQTKGLSNVLVDGTPAVNSAVIPSGSVAGAVAVATDTIAEVVIGRMFQVGVDTEFRVVDLAIN